MWDRPGSEGCVGTQGDYATKEPSENPPWVLIHRTSGQANPLKGTRLKGFSGLLRRRVQVITCPQEEAVKRSSVQSLGLGCQPPPDRGRASRTSGGCSPHTNYSIESCWECSSDHQG